MKKAGLLFLLLSIFQIIYAQCPQCSIDETYSVSPAKPSISADTLPDAFANQPYNEQIQIYLPAQFLHSSGMTVTLNKIQVLSVTGVPFGMQFQSSSATNIFFPAQSPPTTEHACATFCGTPLVPGNYAITVYVKAWAGTVVGEQTSEDFFTLFLKVLPAPASNNGFTISNSQGCAPLTTSYTVNRPSGGDSRFSYQWSFGNGNNSSVETPGSQTYPNAGTFPVTLTTTIDTLNSFYINALQILTCPISNCNDNVLGVIGRPDYYFILKRGSTTVYQSSAIDNAEAPVSYSFSDIALENDVYTIQVMDEDGGLNGSNDACGSVSFNGHQTGWLQLQSSNGVIVRFQIMHPTLTFTDYDTITVYPSPNTPILTSNPGDSVCFGNAIEITASDIGNYLWYKNDTIVPNAETNSLSVIYSGLYKANITNEFGCSKWSAAKNIFMKPIPTQPTFWVTDNLLQTNASMITNQLQWYVLDQNNEGIPIPSATSQTYTIQESGKYFLTAKNYFQCVVSSDSVDVEHTNVSIDESVFNESLKIYPNPTSNILNINFDNSVGIDRLMIYNFIGQLMFEQVIDSFQSAIQYLLDVSTYAKGNYLLILSNQKNQYKHKFIVR